jgi:creatinine amidohydrolase
MSNTSSTARPDWFGSLDLTAPPFLVEDRAWPELSETFDRVLLLPVGATEQHGPHLPVNTDTVIAQSVCAYASSVTGAPVLPPLHYTVSLGHTEKWPGTFAIYHETLMHTVRETAAWALATGWKRLLLVNSHFGNDATLRCAVDRLRFDYPGEFFAATRNTWQLSPSIAQQFSEDAADWHANKAETSLLLFLRPQTVRLSRPADDPDRTAGCVFPHLVAHTSLNGVTGIPSAASAEHGATLLAEMGRALTQIIETARLEQPPLAWRRTTTAFAA